MRKTAALIQNIIQSYRARGTSHPSHYENSPFDLPMKTLCHSYFFKEHKRTFMLSIMQDITIKRIN